MSHSQLTLPSTPLRAFNMLKTSPTSLAQTTAGVWQQPRRRRRRRALQACLETLQGSCTLHPAKERQALRDHPINPTTLWGHQGAVGVVARTPPWASHHQEDDLPGQEQEESQ